MSTYSLRVFKEEDVHFFKHLNICPNYNNAYVNGVYYWQSPIPGNRKLLSLQDGRISIWDTERLGRSNEIWVLNNKEHWTKLLKIEIDHLLKVERMFGLWKNAKVFVESESGQRLLCDIDTKEFSHLEIEPSAARTLVVYHYEDSHVAISRE
ncbi:hypothetical protein REPUB_Repub13aG0061600 [Reevesia pubescens]